jgi:hypothetical protein
MFAGSKRAAGAKRGSDPVRLKSAPKSKNKTYHHFTPTNGQSSALKGQRERQKRRFVIEAQSQVY